MKNNYFLVFLLSVLISLPACEPAPIDNSELSNQSPEWVRQQMIEFIKANDAERFLDVDGIDAIPAVTDTNAYANIDLEEWKANAKTTIELMRMAEQSRIEAEKIRPIFIDMFDAIQAAESKAAADRIARYYSQWIGMTRADGTVVEPTKSPESYFEEVNRPGLSKN